MRLGTAALLFLMVSNPSHAQQPLGLNPSSALGTSLKLDGIVLQHVPDGVLAVSLPPEYIKKFIFFIAKFHGLELLELVDAESKKLTPRTGEAVVPIGICFLDTKEIFPRHKILDRMVQAEGTFSYMNMRGREVTVVAYVGGATRRQ